MTLKRRLLKVESAITAEIREQEIEQTRKGLEFLRACHLPLPPQASESERAEVVSRLLALQVKAKAGTATPADEAAWFAWVDGIHSKYGSTPPT